MINKLLHGDTVLVKHPVTTDGKWKKGELIWNGNEDYYEIKLSDGNHYIITDYPAYDFSIIKVDSDFSMTHGNCKYSDKMFYEDPCNKCLFERQKCHWEPCDDLFDERVLFKPEKLDVASFYPNFHHEVRNLPIHSDNIDALRRYCINDARACAEFMADFNKKENKTMKKQQKKRDRNIIQAKNLEARKIKEIMFNGPATIIKWEPTVHQQIWNEKADKTVVVCKEPDSFDKTTGFLLAILKELLDNKSYGNILEKIDEIKEFDEFSKQTVEEDLKPKYNGEAYKYDNKDKTHFSIKDLKEATEALEDVYVPGSVVKYKNGKKYYMVYAYRFDDQLKEMVYILRPYKGTCFTDNNLEDACKGNVPHSKLIIVRRK